MRRSLIALIFLIGASAAIVGCKTSTASRPATRPAAPSVRDVSAEPDSVLARRVARERFADTTHVHALPSEEGGFLLVTRSAPPTALQPVVLTSYAVVERRSGRVTAWEADVRGSVRWLDATTVEVTLTPGTVQGDPSSPIGSPQDVPRYRIDAATGARS